MIKNTNEKSVLIIMMTHVETVVKLSQKHIDHSIRVELDLDEIDKIK